jgi:hypothetical protein
VTLLALVVAGCTNADDSSDASRDSQAGGGSATPSAFRPEGATAAVAAYLTDRGEEYVGDCATATLPRDRGDWCSTILEDGDDRKVYEVGPVGEDPDVILTIDRRGQARLTPGLRVDVVNGDVGVPRQLTREELLNDPFITFNILLDQQAGIGNGLADIPGTTTQPAGGPGAPGGGGAAGGGTAGPAPPGPTVIVDPDAGAAQYPPSVVIVVVDPTIQVLGEVAFRVTGCLANEPLTVLFDGRPIGVITADAQGTAAGDVTIPAGTAPGTHDLTVKGATCVASTTVRVLGALAFTGASNDTGTTVLVGISVLAVGLVLVVGSRRRRGLGSSGRRSRAT